MPICRGLPRVVRVGDADPETREWEAKASPLCAPHFIFTQIYLYVIPARLKTVPGVIAPDACKRTIQLLERVGMRLDALNRATDKRSVSCCVAVSYIM